MDLLSKAACEVPKRLSKYGSEILFGCQLQQRKKRPRWPEGERLCISAGGRCCETGERGKNHLQKTCPFKSPLN
jgi:hypothetical protein